jgi:hypothetical protein
MKDETLNETETELIEAMPDNEDAPSARDAIELVNDVELV